MGYNVRIQDSSVVIAAEHRQEVMKRWKELNDPKNDPLKRGGSWGGGKGKTEAWFSWMPADYDKTMNQPEQVLEALGFDFDSNQDDPGDIEILGYDSKTGQEDLFFKAIADLIPAGQSITWVGEDGEYYRWMFKDGNMIVQDGEVTFHD